MRNSGNVIQIWERNKEGMGFAACRLLLDSSKKRKENIRNETARSLTLSVSSGV